MGIRDLTITDARRLLVVGIDLVDEKDGPAPPTVADVAKAIAAAGGPPPDPEDPEPTFRNPPPPTAEMLEKARALATRARKAVVDRYGQEYADDLWTRINK